MAIKKRPLTIVVNDKMQTNYQYILIEAEGKNFAPDFRPDLSPALMLKLGVFSGKYLTDCRAEFPKEWFNGARLALKKRDKNLNYFKIEASLPLKYWQAKGWIYKDDPRGWFQWYCRYYLGRRLEEEDRRQIKRWKQMARHIGQIKKNCRYRDLACRPKQRQALLHWAYDSRNI